MTSSTERTTQAAKKQHRCSWCGQSIEPGNTYHRWRWFPGDGDPPASIKMHDECFGAFQASAENEFYLYDNERPECPPPSTP